MLYAISLKLCFLATWSRTFQKRPPRRYSTTTSYIALAWFSIRLLLVCGSLPKGAKGDPIGLVPGPAKWVHCGWLLGGGILLTDVETYSGLLLISGTCEWSRSEPCRPPLEVGQEADHLRQKGNSWLVGKDVHLCRVKPDISAVLTDTSGLDPSMCMVLIHGCYKC